MVAIHAKVYLRKLKRNIIVYSDFNYSYFPNSKLEKGSAMVINPWSGSNTFNEER